MWIIRCLFDLKFIYISRISWCNWYGRNRHPKGIYKWRSIMGWYSKYSRICSRRARNGSLKQLRVIVIKMVNNKIHYKLWHQLTLVGVTLHAHAPTDAGVTHAGRWKRSGAQWNRRVSGGVASVCHGTAPRSLLLPRGANHLPISHKPTIHKPSAPLFWDFPFSLFPFTIPFLILPLPHFQDIFPKKYWCVFYETSQNRMYIMRYRLWTNPFYQI